MEAAAVAGSPEGATPGGYRPQLDGLRAVAVYLVVAFHAGADRFAGGFVGVDVFFVLSGYLVTQLLLRDLAGSRRVGLARFYARRARRLLPAAFVALVVTAILFAAVASRAEVSESVRAFRAAFLYFANWFYIGESTQYFGADIEASPVVHFWSLAVEEQFYLAWPLLLAGLFFLTRRFAGRQSVAVRVVVVAGGLLSLAWALHLADTDLNRAYYGTDARAYQLLAGAFLALSPEWFALGDRWRRWLQRLAPFFLGGVLLLATSALSLDVIERGVAIAATTCLLILAIENATGGVVKRVLSSAPAVYLGRISYATYLWHWPVIVVATRVAAPSPTTTAAITAFVATGLASLSYQLLERPVRESRWLDRHRVPAIGAGLALSALGGLLIVPAILEDPGASGASARGTVSGVTPVPDDLDWEGARDDRGLANCAGQPVSACVFVEGSGLRVALIGDSHAWALRPALAEVARRESWTLAVLVAPVCPWQEDLAYLLPYGQDATNRERAGECRERKTDWYRRVIPELDPDLVVVTHRALDDPTNPVVLLDGAGSSIEVGDDRFARVVRAASERTLAALRAAGRDVVIVEPVPVARHEFNPLDCVSAADYLDECRYVVSERATPVERAYRALSDGDGTWVLDLDRLVCPYLPICDPVVGGLIVKRDFGHLTTAYSESLAPDLRTYFRENRIIAG